MQLKPYELEDWITALSKNPDAAVTVQPDPEPYSVITQPATWFLGVYASAHFYIPTDEDVTRIADAMPGLFETFDQLTGRQLSQVQNGDTGKVGALTDKKRERIAKEFESERDGKASVNAFAKVTEESSSQFAFRTLSAFKASSRPRCEFQKLSYLQIQVPLSFWQSHRRELTAWWFSALGILKPEQAYMGLSFGYPPILERYPFIEPAEFALAKQFYGLDIEKPFFMHSVNLTSGRHLEQGMKTPTFGVLVRGGYLDRLGGEAALRGALAGDDRIHVTPCAGGLWLQAGDEPALYPVEEGIPAHVAKIAQALKPVRLETLWLISYPPNLPKDNCFTPPTSRQWLARFDAEGDWPSPDARKWQTTEAIKQANAKETNGIEGLRGLPGEPVPQSGTWWTPAMPGEAGRKQFNKGDNFPDKEHTDYGAVVWYLEN